MIDSLTMLAMANPIEHVIDKPLTANWGISVYTVMLVIDALITMAIVIPAAKKIATGKSGTVEDLRAKGAFANFVEIICVYLRTEVFEPVLREHTDRFTPLLWTFFWFILVCNMVGLIPIMDVTAAMGINHGHGIWGTPTQSIWVTGALATIAFFAINTPALVKDPIGYAKHLTGGAPWYMWIILIPVEFVGLFVKPFALALRLFANMTGGHLVIAVLLSFVPELIRSAALGPAVGAGVAVVPLLGTVAINLLEILVGFIQAFIFTFLTCLFIAQLMVHDEEHGEQHGVHEEQHNAAGVNVENVEYSGNHPQIANSHVGGAH